MTAMTETISQMTRAELLDMLEMIVEQKVLEILNDPDEGLEVEPALLERLLHQQRAVAEGERGRSLDDVVAELGL
jgi:hypothetical protein